MRYANLFYKLSVILDEEILNYHFKYSIDFFRDSGVIYQFWREDFKTVVFIKSHLILRMDDNDVTPQLISGRELQRGLGLLGFLLPIILYLGNWLIFGDTTLQGSISGYYNTGMRDVLVGTLCSFGVGLMAYKGHGLIDNIVASLSGIFAIGTALFGTPPSNVYDPTEKITHAIFAVLFYSSLVVFSLYLFRKSDSDSVPTRKKRMRNRVYLFAGIVMFISIIAISITWILNLKILDDKAIFWFEALANFAFGISWFVKGGLVTALNDE